MASLVEMQELTDAGTQSTYLQSSEDCCDVHTLHTIMSGLQQIPTPPLSPDSSSSSTLPYTLESSVEDQQHEALLDQMLECEQIPTFVDVEDTDSYIDSPSSYAASPVDVDDTIISICTDTGAALLIQDCMWNSRAYEPRSLIGTYTPAPSPPPASSDNTKEEEVQNTSEELSNTQEREMVKQPDAVEGEECISPCDIFPTYTLMVDSKEGVKIAAKPRSNTSEHGQGGNMARHHQAISSESDEEIDVVTVTERLPTRMSTRKRQVPVSAPCSRHTSPSPPLPKKRKYTGKRLQRIHSNNASSNVGDGTESDDEHRRASHNILERKRRNDLKFSFQLLREQVPDLKENLRAPKVTILRKAAQFILQSREEGEIMKQELERERKREAKLRQRLAYLKAMSVC